ncbi:MAG TPA: hypothetical protein VFY40_11160 [Blastocatellia bacterium]|nr:hypothetical protein [Blastocatellia bacterium]
MKIEKNPAPVHEATPPSEEGKTLLERASAPTVRDLREWAKDLLRTIEAEMELTSPDDGLQRQGD